MLPKLFGTRPLPEPGLIPCQLDHEHRKKAEHIGDQAVGFPGIWYAETHIWCHGNEVNY